MLRRRLLLASVALTLAALGMGLALRQCTGPSPRLATLVHGGAGPPTLVLLHGYGSSADKWVPFTRTIRLPAGGRFVFPLAPEATVPPDGPVDGRAWWRLDLASHIPPGGGLPDLSGKRPPEIEQASQLVRELLRELRRPTQAAILLGGFSQGAMVAAQVAFASHEPLAALILLSGTPVDESTWEAGFAARRGLPIFMSHGRADEVLPFALAERFHGKLQAAGLDVTWLPFEGGHAIPAEVVTALNEFIGSLPPMR